MKHYKRLSETDFNKVKSLLNQGFNLPKIMMITKRGAGTIGWVKRADNLDHYRQLIREYMAQKELRRAGGLNRPKQDQKESQVSDNSVERAVEALDETLEDLKMKVTEVITLGVSEQVKKEIAQNQQELLELREFKAALKNNNWKTALTQRLRGY